MPGAIVIRQILDEILHYGTTVAISQIKHFGTTSPLLYLYDLTCFVLLKKIAQQGRFSENCQNTACLPQKDRNTLFLDGIISPNSVASEHPTSRGIWNGMRRVAEQAFIRRTERLLLVPKYRLPSPLI